MKFKDTPYERISVESPFQESCLRGICDTAAKYLSDYDLSGIA